MSSKKVYLLTAGFLSGCSALIYQIVWVRQFGFVFGVTTFAVSAVLTAFMAGLAFGSLLFGKIVDKKQNPVNLFVILQIGIALFALFFPFLLKSLLGIYTILAQNFPLNFWGTQILRFILAFLFLLIPTTLMGGTIPILSKLVVNDTKSLGFNIGHLYSLNNLGAVVGAFLTGFIFIATFGLNFSQIVAAVLNIFAAIIIFAQFKNFTFTFVEPKPVQESPNPKISNLAINVVLWAFALEGFTTLAYEVIWTRILEGYSFDKSIYFYSTVIICFIFGLSLGSLLVAKWIDKNKNLFHLFGMIEIIIAISATLVLPVFHKLSAYLTTLRPEYTENWLKHLGTEYFLFFLIMLVPTTLMGATFPIVGKIYTTTLANLGSRIGKIGYLDTVGSIFGAFVAGFFMIPVLGVVTSAIITAVMNLVIGVAIILVQPNFNLKKKSAWLVPSLIVFCLALLTIPSKDYFKNWQMRREGDRLLFYKEGVGSTVAVPQHPDGIKMLAINGSVTAFTNYDDIRVHKMLGYLPYMIHPQPKNALVIGLGIGITSQSLIQETIDYVDCVEISPVVIKASMAAFRQDNDNVFDNPKFNLILDDGRSHLFTTEKKYDIITSNAIHSRLSGNIYTKDFYELCKSKMTENGVVCQWMPTNWMSEYEYKTLLKAFVDVFPNSSVWCINSAHFLLVGHNFPLQYDYDKFVRRYQAPKVQQDLKSINLQNPVAFLAQYICDQDKLDEYIGTAPPHSDNHPIAEVSKVVSKLPNYDMVYHTFQKQSPIDDILTTSGREAELDSAKKHISTYMQANSLFWWGAFQLYYGNLPQKAFESFQRALNFVDDDYRFHDEIASLYYKAGQYEQAAEHLQKLLTIVPDYALKHENLGMVYLDAGKLDKAEEAFKNALEIDNERPLPHYFLASLYGNKNRYDLAEQELFKVIDTYPDFAGSYYNLGLAYLMQNKNDKALEAFRICQQKDENYKDVGSQIRKLAHK